MLLSTRARLALSISTVGSMMWFTELDVNFIDDYFMTGDLDSNDVQEGYEFVNIPRVSVAELDADAVAGISLTS